jgi:hypothetical protein
MRCNAAVVCIGFAVDIQVKTAIPVGYKRKIKHDDITCRLGEAMTGNSDCSEASKQQPAKKVSITII